MQCKKALEDCGRSYSFGTGAQDEKFTYDPTKDESPERVTYNDQALIYGNETWLYQIQGTAAAFQPNKLTSPYQTIVPAANGNPPTTTATK